MAEIKGRIESISPIQHIPTKSGKVMEKRELVLDATRYDSLTGERGYDNYPMLEFSGDRCRELDNYSLGDAVNVTYNLEGMKYTDKQGLVKYFTKARAYKIELIGKKTPVNVQNIQPQNIKPQNVQPINYEQYAPQQPNRGDDIPF